eukprot:321485-Prymnesium_polylepis.1
MGKLQALRDIQVRYREMRDQTVTLDGGLSKTFGDFFVSSKLFWNDDGEPLAVSQMLDPRTAFFLEFA